ncbi:MAG TPA: carbohydrate ABC transporter permease [Planctomycetes bacterium]|jgi:inositol-phosphate transport system permease protein|nr:carbohydrate ABC transporter permease [Candidatus Lambdaproteobacteria bacterium]HIK91252.1 carbohydrate ABC transporter permease [Planctomycetota bacterium]
MNVALGSPQPRTPWDRLAVRAKWMRRAKLGAIYGFLIAVSVPVLLPFFWMASVAFSSKTGTVDTIILWRSMAILVPFVLACWICSTIGATARQMFFGFAAITAIAVVAFVVFVLPDLHLGNFIFITEKDFSNTVRERRSGVKLGDFAGGINFPSVWSAFANSLYLAGGQTLIVATVASLAGYYLSRFKFAGRAAMLRTLLVLHAFPVLTLIVPLFLTLNFVGLLDQLLGVMLVLVGFELPFAIFIMKGFFDAVPWEIEMSALTDGASRRQAFVQVVLPQVSNGLIAISVFSFIRGWEEYIFVFTFLIENVNWTMSLYMFFVRDDIMGIDFGLVSAVGVFYLAPSLVLYAVAQKYLMQMTIGGVKG